MDVSCLLGNGLKLTIVIRWWDLLIFAIVAIVAYWYWFRRKNGTSTVEINEIKLGFQAGSVTLKVDDSVRKLAYKIWVELATRKIGLPFDEENDVIKEVYDSWYAAFFNIRNAVEDVAPRKNSSATELVDLSIRVLNEGLRPHLTKWQARYRRWYERACAEKPDADPQTIQRDFPKYHELVRDLEATNEKMIGFAEELKKIFSEKSAK